MRMHKPSHVHRKWNVCTNFVRMRRPVHLHRIWNVCITFCAHAQARDRRGAGEAGRDPGGAGWQAEPAGPQALVLGLKLFGLEKINNYYSIFEY